MGAPRELLEVLEDIPGNFPEGVPFETATTANLVLKKYAALDLVMASHATKKRQVPS